MPRALWSGSISFGLVNIPVRLAVAVKDRSVRFHKLHRSDGVRLHQKMVCPADGEEVTDEETARGYEISQGAYVVVEQEELDALAPRSSRTIDITDFVDLADIDPVYYERPYYLLPEEQAARPYGLLVRAMTDARKVGIARFVMHNKEYLAALRPVGKVICLETMRFADEVVTADVFEEAVPEPDAKARELDIALQLIDMLSAAFEPGKYRDEHREALLALVERKAEGEEVITAPVEAEETGKVIDLMAALEESLQRARERQREEKGTGAARKKAPVAGRKRQRSAG